MTNAEAGPVIRIMLVEDNAAYREVIALAITDQSDMTMVADFGTTEGALQHLEAMSPDKQPDILLLDLRLPGMNGLEAISHFHGMAAAMRIIVLTQSDTPGDIARAIREGVSGYLLKRATLAEITHGIRHRCLRRRLARQRCGSPHSHLAAAARQFRCRAAYRAGARNPRTVGRGAAEEGDFSPSWHQLFDRRHPRLTDLRKTAGHQCPRGSR